MNATKRLLACILAAVLLFVLLPRGGRAAPEEPPEGWTGIYTREDLEKITYSPEGKFILMNDLDLSEASFKPLCSEDLPFTGVLDGNGHSVYGLTVTSEKGAAGLFSYVTGGAIRNLSVSGSVTAPVAGIVAGNVTDATLSDVTASGTVTASFCGGGVVGQSGGAKTSLSKCTSSVALSGTVTGKTELFLGGVVGAVYGTGTEISSSEFKGSLTAKGPYLSVGGILGAAEGTAVITACGNEGTLSLSATDTSCAGGIVGRGGSKGLTVSKCSFRADWSVSGSSALIRMGGICGLLSAEVASSVSDCVTYGSLTYTGAAAYVGGTVGHVIAGAGNASVLRCASTAKITGAGSPLFLGGIVGMNLSVSSQALVEDCYGAGVIAHTGDIVDITGTVHSYGFGGIVGHNGGYAASILRRCFSLYSFQLVNTVAEGAVVGTCYHYSDSAEISVENCFYRDGEVEFFAFPVSGAALSDPETYETFDFEQVWVMNLLTGLPALKIVDGLITTSPAGDVDGNGILTAYDARLLGLFLTGEVDLSQLQRTRADINGDGILNARDMALILLGAR